MSGRLFIVSAPSGAGKTSLVQALLRAESGIELSVSYTTRAPRAGELDGRDYHFISRTVFEQMLGRGEFLECALVHDNYYGTSEAWVRSHLGKGLNILLEIDWQGAEQVRKRVPDAIGIFVLPPAPSLVVLEKRLRSRGQDSEEVIQRRLDAAREEVSHAGEYDYVIINDQFDEALRDMSAVIRVARLHTAAQIAAHPRLLEV